MYVHRVLTKIYIFYYKICVFNKIDYINLCGFHNTYNIEGREKRKMELFKMKTI